MRASRAWVSARGQDLGGDAVELGVELERGDELAGAGDLEVHVAERVLGAEDVGQRDVLGLAVDLAGDEAHRDAGDGRPQRHTGLQQRQRRGADRAHRGGAVGAHRLGELADRVGELLAGRQHRQQRTARERTVADLAALGRAHATGLTGGERREDVLVHVAARLLRGERVQLLLEGQHVQRGDAQDLGLAALEQRRAVHARDDLDLGGQRPDVGQAAAVDADLVAQHALADEALFSERNAAPSSFSRPSNCSPSFSSTVALISSRRSSRSCLPAMVSAGARSALAAASTAA